MNKKIQGDFQICISVLLTGSFCTCQHNLKEKSNAVNMVEILLDLLPCRNLWPNLGLEILISLLEGHLAHQIDFTIRVFFKKCRKVY